MARQARVYFLDVRFRSSFADIYHVRSGSMKPTIVGGDRVLADKMAYGLSVPFTNLVLWRRTDPQCGDIVTLYSHEGGERLLKRIVGMPGDVISMQDSTLFINDSPLVYLPPSPGESVALPDAGAYVFRREDLTSQVHAVMFIPGRPAMRTFGPVIVHAGEYFVWGITWMTARIRATLASSRKERLAAACSPWDIRSTRLTITYAHGP